MMTIQKMLGFTLLAMPFLFLIQLRILLAPPIMVKARFDVQKIAMRHGYWTKPFFKRELVCEVEST